MKQLKTREEVLIDFNRRGICISEWARDHNLARQTVHDVLRGRSKGYRGKAHNAAVLLGIKDGILIHENNGQE